MGKVVGLYICAKAGAPMVEVGYVNAIEGAGLEGDRYFFGRGAWSKSERKVVRHVSLIESEAIGDAAQDMDEPFSAAETRRSIVTNGIALNELVGREFTVGNVRMRGIELCHPCPRPDKLAGKKGFADLFKDRGGLRAAILSTGSIELDSEIKV